MNRIATVIAVQVLAGAIACGKKQPAISNTAVGSAVVTNVPQPSVVVGAAGGSNGAAPAQAVVDPQLQARCAEPCLILAAVDLADGPQKAYCDTCGTVNPNACDPAAWPLKSDAGGVVSCEVYDELRNCIYANAGFTFRKAQWKTRFTNQPWFKADPAFSDSKLSAVASKNVGVLKASAHACRISQAQAVDPADAKTVLAWFAARKKGTPPLPADLGDRTDDNAATFKQLWLTGDMLIREAWQPLEKTLCDGQRGEVCITVRTGQPAPDCKGDNESCEGFDWVVFGLTKHAIVSLRANASACPFVYELVGGREVFVGEAIANLFLPVLESTQQLAVPAAVQCGGTRRFKIAEEKREVSHLDLLALAVGDAVVQPTICRDNAQHALCSDDGRYHELATGETLVVEFDVPANQCGAVQLVSNGYYTRQ